MRWLTASLMFAPVMLIGCGGGNYDGQMSAVTPPPHPVPGQSPNVGPVPEGDTVVIDHFGDPHLIER